MNNAGGSPVHDGVVRYGTDSKDPGQTVKNPIGLDPGHLSVIFRMRMDNLKPRTTYCYTVDSREATGAGDEVKSTDKKFTTPQ